MQQLHRRRVETKVVVNKEGCVGCGICLTFCPVDALKGWSVLEVDQDECIDCLKCCDVCPVDAVMVEP